MQSFAPSLFWAAMTGFPGAVFSFASCILRLKNLNHQGLNTQTDTNQAQLTQQRNKIQLYSKLLLLLMYGFIINSCTHSKVYGVTTKNNTSIEFIICEVWLQIHECKHKLWSFLWLADKQFVEKSGWMYTKDELSILKIYLSDE